MASKIERIAGLAMGLGQRHLADYGAVRSRHDFTQRQLMSCLILRSYLKVTYRGLVDLLAGHDTLRRILGMEEKLPHYTTLQKFSARKDVLAVADAMIAQIGSAALRMAGKKRPLPLTRPAWRRRQPARISPAVRDAKGANGSSFPWPWSAAVCFPSGWFLTGGRGTTNARRLS